MILSHVPLLPSLPYRHHCDYRYITAHHTTSTPIQPQFTHTHTQYLSPERARGLPHDTRKSDVWSLGVTFFEILMGRTPFEHSEGEQFTTKEDLEMYWNRTVRGSRTGQSADTDVCVAPWQVGRHVEDVEGAREAPSPDDTPQC